VPLGLGEALFVLSVPLGLGEVVLAPDFMTLGIAWGEIFRSDLPETDGEGAEAAGDGEEGLGEGLVLATTVGDGETEGVATDAVGLGTVTLGLAATGLSDALGDSVFWEFSVGVWLPGIGIMRIRACSPMATMIDGCI
jgi:hypothetical protein